LTQEDNGKRIKFVGDDTKISKTYLTDHHAVNLMNEEMAKILNAEIKSKFIKLRK